jgi:hypothetical protein
MTALISLAQVKAILEIESTDDTYDAAMTAALPLVTQWFEMYCDRGLAEREIEDEEYMFPGTGRLYLRSFPVTLLTAIKKDEVDSDPSQYLLNGRDGYIVGKQGAPRLDDAEVVKVSYTGGYAQEDVPADLARAYAVAVGVRAGEPTAIAASSSSGTAAIKAIGLGGGALSVQFDVADPPVGGISGNYSVSNVPVEVQNQASVLNYYRRMGV